MKRIIAAFTCLLLATALHAQNADLPDTPIRDMNTSKKVNFSDAVTKGKVTVISFWATWCVPCKKEIKNISLKLPEWQKEVDFNYMTVSMDETRAEGLVRSYAKSQGWKFPFYMDPNSDLKRSLNFQNIPFLVIIDKTGKVVFSHSGYEEGSEEEVFKKVKELALK